MLQSLHSIRQRNEESTHFHASRETLSYFSHLPPGSATAHEIREIPRRAALTETCLSVSQIRRWFVADTTSGPGESFSGHRETRRLSRTVPGPQVRAVLQLQHGRYGDERHDAEQQGQQHQSLRYAGTRSPRVVLHIRARLPSVRIRVCVYIYMCICTCIIYTCINIRVAHVRNRGYVYVCTEQQSIRLTAINTLSPCTLFSRPLLLPSSFAISSAAVYANGAVDTSYDYAVPELGTVPLLNQDGTGRGPPAPPASTATSDQDTIFSKTSSRGNKTENKKVRVHREVSINVWMAHCKLRCIVEWWNCRNLIRYENGFGMKFLFRGFNWYIFFYIKFHTVSRGRNSSFECCDYFIFKNSDDWWKCLVDGSRIRISINFWVRVWFVLYS